MSTRCRLPAILTLIASLVFGGSVLARDLPEIRSDGVLRHLAIPYANFVTGSGDGLDMDLIRGFAVHLGLQYELVATNWDNAYGDLTGRHARANGDNAELLGETPIRGDLIANGLTILGWREQVVAFSEPTFPSGVWLLARAESGLQPITPGPSIEADISATRRKLAGVSVLALANTCLDPDLYQLDEAAGEIRMAPPGRQLNEMVPALLNRDAETTLLDVPDALVALERWPGAIKVLGPISGEQRMAVAFRPGSPLLREAFNAYLRDLRSSGRYAALVEKYYPSVFAHYPEFFDANRTNLN